MDNFSYICTHLGEEDIANQAAKSVTPPLYLTSLHVFNSIEDLLGFNAADAQEEFIYGRVSNPTTALLEKKLAALDNADGALCFSSGMAAITSAIMHCVEAGDHIVTLKNVYGPVNTFCNTQLKKLSIDTTFVDGRDPEDFAKAIRPNTKLFYLESPTSAVMELQDLEAVVRIAKQHGIKTAIDNTWATPINLKPIDLGIDIAVYTLSKYVGGHSDVIGGAICASKEIITAIQTNERELFGGILGPFEAWLCIRALRTFPLRVKQSGATATAVAKLLEKHPKVRRVNYPGINSYDQKELSDKLLKGSTGLLSFEIDGTVEQAMKVVNSLKLFHKGVSWGGFESLACMPMYKYSEDQALERNSNRNLIRIYCGLEDENLLLEDVANAMQQL